MLGLPVLSSTVPGATTNGSGHKSDPDLHQHQQHHTPQQQQHHHQQQQQHLSNPTMAHSAHISRPAMGLSACTLAAMAAAAAVGPLSFNAHSNGAGSLISRSTCNLGAKDRRPCDICGDVSAGFHCNAYVCEACKKFFIRSSKGDNFAKYTCTKSNVCEINKDTRTHCQRCRYQKCLRLGMVLPGAAVFPATDISEIPCRVCGAKSSGFHFGAITCEGCKGFFRRTINERESQRYTCRNGGNCAVTGATRNNCKSCRYRRCLAVGMSKDGSRIGRQPNAVKHRCAIEIEQLRSAVSCAASYQSKSPAKYYVSNNPFPEINRRFSLDDHSRSFSTCYSRPDSTMAHSYVTNPAPNANVICIHPGPTDFPLISGVPESAPFTHDSTFTRSGRLHPRHHQHHNAHHLSSDLRTHPTQQSDLEQAHPENRLSYTSHRTGQPPPPLPSYTSAQGDSMESIQAENHSDHDLRLVPKSEAKDEQHSIAFEVLKCETDSVGRTGVGANDYLSLGHVSAVHESQHTVASLTHPIGLLQLSQAAQYYSQKEQEQEFAAKFSLQTTEHNDGDCFSSMPPTFMAQGCERPSERTNVSYGMDLEVSTSIPSPGVDRESIKREEQEEEENNASELHVDVWSRNKLRDPSLHTPNWGLEVSDGQISGRRGSTESQIMTCLDASAQPASCTMNHLNLEHRSGSLSETVMSHFGLRNSERVTMCGASSMTKMNSPQCYTPPDKSDAYGVKTFHANYVNKSISRLDLTETKTGTHQQFYTLPDHAYVDTVGTVRCDTKPDEFCYKRGSHQEMDVTYTRATNPNGSPLVLNSQTSVSTEHPVSGPSPNKLSITDRHRSNPNSVANYFPPSKAFLSRYQANFNKSDGGTSPTSTLSRTPPNSSDDRIIAESTYHTLSPMHATHVLPTSGETNTLFQPSHSETNSELMDVMPVMSQIQESGSHSSQLTEWASEWLRAGRTHPSSVQYSTEVQIGCSPQRQRRRPEAVEATNGSQDCGSPQETPSALVARYLRHTQSMLLATGRTVGSLDAILGSKPDVANTVHPTETQSQQQMDGESANAMLLLGDHTDRSPFEQVETQPQKLLSLLEKVDLDIESPRWLEQSVPLKDDSHRADGKPDSFVHIDMQSYSVNPSDTSIQPHSFPESSQQTGLRVFCGVNCLTQDDSLSLDGLNGANNCGFLNSTEQSGLVRTSVSTAMPVEQDSMRKCLMEHRQLAETVTGAIYSHLASRGPTSLELFIERVVKAAKNLRSIRNRVSGAVEIDNCSSPDQLWSRIMEHFELHAHQIIQFARAIPGFRELSRLDMKALVQSGMHPILLTQLSRDYDASSLEYNYFDFIPAERDVILRAFPQFQRIADQLCVTGNMLHTLRLDEIEAGLLCCIALLHGDGQEVFEEPAKVQTIYQQALSALDKYEQARSNSENRARQILTLIPVLTEMSREHQLIVKQFRRDRFQLQFPDLYVQMFRLDEDMAGAE